MGKCHEGFYHTNFNVPFDVSAVFVDISVFFLQMYDLGLFRRKMSTSCTTKFEDEESGSNVQLII